MNEILIILVIKKVIDIEEVDEVYVVCIVLNSFKNENHKVLVILWFVLNLAKVKEVHNFVEMVLDKEETIG